jgi:hypothetical protein
MGKRKHDHFREAFAMFPKRMWFKCPEWMDFSPAARDIYCMLKASYSGTNNGEIHLYYSQLLKVSGLKSRHTIAKAFKELEEKGWIERNKLGGLLHHPTCFKLTWKVDFDPMV